MKALCEQLDGAYLCGGTGDGLHMRLEERKAAVEIGVELCKKHDKFSLVQVGAYTMRDAVELAEHAAKVGADGISSVSACGYFAQGADGVLSRADRGFCTAKPSCITCRSRVRRFPLRRSRRRWRVPGVTGIKSSTNDFFFTQQLMDAKPEGAIVFNGKDEYLAPAVLHGADGGIGMWAKRVFQRRTPHLSSCKSRKDRGSISRSKKPKRPVLHRNAKRTAFMLCLPYCIIFGKHDRGFRAPNPYYDAEFIKASSRKHRP